MSGSSGVRAGAGARLEIAAVDPDDDEAYAAFHHLMDSGEREALGDLTTVWSAPEFRVLLRDVSGPVRWIAHLGLLDGEPVVAGRQRLPVADNLDSCDISVWAEARHRRRGLGSAMLAHLEDLGRAAGRTLSDARVSWLYDLGPGGDGHPGTAFARHHGYPLVLEDVQRLLVVPVDDALLDALAAEVAPHHAAYRLECFTGPMPDEIAESWSALSATTITEAPTGDRVVEPETGGVEVVRSMEAVAERQGRTLVHCVALDARAEVAALTQLGVSSHDGRCYQWGTIVRRADRGHRLGLAVKVANHRQLQQLPQAVGVREVVTYNAEVNTHMIEVNERLGFRPVARMGEYQKHLT